MFASVLFCCFFVCRGVRIFDRTPARQRVHDTHAHNHQNENSLLFGLSVDIEDDVFCVRLELASDNIDSLDSSCRVGECIACLLFNCSIFPIIQFKN